VIGIVTWMISVVTVDYQSFILQDIVTGEVLIVSVCTFRAGDDRNVTVEQECDRGQHRRVQMPCTGITATDYSVVV